MGIGPRIKGRFVKWKIFIGASTRNIILIDLLNGMEFLCILETKKSLLDRRFSEEEVWKVVFEYERGQGPQARWLYYLLLDMLEHC